MARVCLLGKLSAKDLFGEQNPIGEYVQIENVRFKVKGILQERGVSPMGDEFDRRMVIPLSACPWQWRGRLQWRPTCRYMDILAAPALFVCLCR